MSLLPACEVVHTTECVPPPPGQPGCNRDTGGPDTLDTDSGGATDTEPTGLDDTGWPAGAWIAALQWKGLTFDTIQDAIVEADDGDTVLVSPGTHYETIDFHGKGIHVRSTHGANATVLAGAGEDMASVVYLRGQEPDSAILEGFTVTGGTGLHNHGGGIYVENADPLIMHNIIVGNTTGIGGGVYLRHGAATLTNNIILDNWADQGGGGVTCSNCKGLVAYNTFVGNDGVEGPFGEWFYEVEGDLFGNIIVLPDDAEHAVRYMGPFNGYTFECAYNLLTPEVPWSHDPTLEWPEGEGLLYEVPEFVNADGGDYRLAPGSPGVDAGPPEDLDADGTRADLGAFGGVYGDWDPNEGRHPRAGSPWE